MNTKYNSTRHAKFLINYHFIWIPKYRKHILDNEELVSLVRKTIEEQAIKYSYEIIALEIMPDHIHLSISTLPKYSPAELINKIKGSTGIRIAHKFPELKKRGKIWSRSYFCSTTGNVSTETIKQYIENQWSKIK